MSLLSTKKFSSTLQFQSHIVLFSIVFTWKSWKSNVKFEKESKKALLIQLQLFIIYKPACLHKYFHGRALSIDPGIFFERALWAESGELKQTRRRRKQERRLKM